MSSAFIIDKKGEASLLIYKIQLSSFTKKSLKTDIATYYIVVLIYPVS